ncbi:MAG: hypothetical protein Fues2KO_37870 [Fuerstiella sp.]
MNSANLRFFAVSAILAACTRPAATLGGTMSGPPRPDSRLRLDVKRVCVCSAAAASLGE